MSIKPTFVLEHPHVKADLGCEKGQSKSVAKMAVFRNLRV